MPAGPASETLATLDALRPYPGDSTRADGPVAVDATDRLLLDAARAAIEAAGPGEVVTIGDRFGALTIGAIGLGARDVRVHQDPVDAEAALRANALVTHRSSFGHQPLGPELLAGARVVLLQLPKSVAELSEIAELVARHATDDAVLFAGGRVKHMTHAMNEVLATAFAEVTPSLARQKSRLLVARGLRPEARERPLTYPLRETIGGVPGLDASLTVVAHGGVFGGTNLDGGTRLLLEHSGRWPSPGGVVPFGAAGIHDAGIHDDAAVPGAHPASSPVPTAVDLGCGSGILAVALARRGFEVVATDRSAAAVGSAAATAAANGVGHLVRAVRDDAGASLPDASAALVLLNPPFHDRAALATDAAHRMFETAGRILRPGGELWTVFNSALRYRPALERAVGPTAQIARDPRFTVTRSVRTNG
ncbi:class I SAM-dependent methyltransferase [Myceligenerans crystallogenes]|uniref:Methyltransferase n=1 Tax=Myceligenerans crystallogenes TaxID=316335 RepID=A0ABN2NBF2_9MICO